MSSAAKDTLTAATHEAQTVAKESLHVASEAVQSRAYIYPPYGVLYLLRHRSLWPPVTSRILPCLTLSVAVLVPMFLFTYLPQAAFLTLVNGPMGPINAILLVCSESAGIINALAKAFLLEEALLDVFDATLVQEGHAPLVENGRVLKRGVSSMDGVSKLGKMITKPLQQFSPSYLAQYVMLLPLNLIPIVGTAIFLVTQGRKVGPSCHSRYYQLKGFSKTQREEHIKKNQAGYMAFGTISTFMNLVPLASIVFNFTSTVGAALWAADMEKKAGKARATDTQ